MIDHTNLWKKLSLQNLYKIHHPSEFYTEKKKTTVDYQNNKKIDWIIITWKTWGLREAWSRRWRESNPQSDPSFDAVVASAFPFSGLISSPFFTLCISKTASNKGFSLSIFTLSIRKWQAEERRFSGSVWVITTELIFNLPLTLINYNKLLKLFKIYDKSHRSSVGDTSKMNQFE